MSGGGARTLWLLRHAKASAGREDQPDHERPLEPRGRDDAERLGRHLAQHGARFDLALCSTAVRARETLEHLTRGLGAAPTTELDGELYLTGPAPLRARVQAVPDAVASLLLVGHNPGIGELAARLAERGDAGLRAALRRKFPTCALAELRLDGARWRALARGCELASYLTPKLMQQEMGS